MSTLKKAVLVSLAIIGTVTVVTTMALVAVSADMYMDDWRG